MSSRDGLPGMWGGVVILLFCSVSLFRARRKGMLKDSSHVICNSLDKNFFQSSCGWHGVIHSYDFGAGARHRGLKYETDDDPAQP